MKKENKNLLKVFLFFAFIILTISFSDIALSEKISSENSKLYPVISNNGFVQLYLTEPEKYNFGESIIEKELIEKIGNTKKNITILSFDFDNANLIEALLDAAKRNVKIRIICDLNNTPQQVLKIFQSQNWLVYYKSKVLMHHKIIIFDESLVGLGSMNFTVSCMYVNNNDFYFIKNEKVAKMLESYFDYLAYGKNKEIMQKPQNIDGISFYFANSPYYNINDNIANLLDKANTRIVFAYSTFTNENIAKKIIKIIEDKRLFFFGLLEKRNAYSKYSVYSYFLNNNLHIYLDRNDYYMHHKMMIIDNTVITGSYAISDRKNTEKSIEFNDDLSFSFEDEKISDFLVEYLKSLILR
ncbi:MAG: hypothetical protein GYA61_06365 [Spirochaetales bacterium]|nr:hypothetical protein [Spirochaetales bacterium]